MFALTQAPTNNRCNLCGEPCPGGEEAMDVHKMTVHVNPKFMRYSCRDCGRRFLLVSLLDEHRCPAAKDEGPPPTDAAVTSRRKG